MVKSTRTGYICNSIPRADWQRTLILQKASDQITNSRLRKRSITRGAPLRGSPIRQPNLLAKLLALDPTTRARIIKAREYPAGEMLFQQNDRRKSLYVIKSGTVRAFYTAPSGREITLAYWQAGDLLGADRLYEGGIFRWSCQTIDPTEAYAILETDMRTLVADVPELAVAIVEALSFKVQWLSSLVQVLGTDR